MKLVSAILGIASGAFLWVTLGGIQPVWATGLLALGFGFYMWGFCFGCLYVLRLAGQKGKAKVDSARGALKNLSKKGVSHGEEENSDG